LNDYFTLYFSEKISDFLKMPLGKMCSQEAVIYSILLFD